VQRRLFGAGLGLRLGVAAQVAVPGAVQAAAELAAEAAHGRSAGPDAVGLEQVIGQLLVGPGGPVQAAGGRPVDHPALDRVGQAGGDLGRGALGLAGPEAVGAAVEGGVEPALDGARRDAQVGGAVRVPPAAMGQEHDLEAVAPLAVRGPAERLRKAPGLGVRQVDADHGLPPFSL
jgi:hypothetical protein